MKKKKPIPLKLKVVHYCPQCFTTVPKKDNDLMIIVARECEKHKPKFVDSGILGISVPKKFLKEFKILMQPKKLISMKTPV